MFVTSIAGAHERTRLILVIGPGVSKPDGWKQIQGSRFRPAVGDTDAHENVVARGLRVLHEDVEIAIFFKHSGFQELVFGLVLSAAAILLN